MRSATTPAWVWTTCYVAAPFLWYAWTTTQTRSCRSASAPAAAVVAPRRSGGSATSLSESLFPAFYTAPKPPAGGARNGAASSGGSGGSSGGGGASRSSSSGSMGEKAVFALPPLPSLELWEPSAPMAGLRGTCWTLRPEVVPADIPDDFLYDVCLGDRVIQVQHPFVENRAVFGAFAGWVDDAAAPDGAGGGGAAGGFTQLYTGGSVCAGFGERKATLRFACDNSAPLGVLRLVSVKEPEVCVYELQLVTAAACRQ